MTPTSDEKSYRPGVGMVILNPRAEVLVARRIDTPGDAWQMPQGGIDAGEDPRTALFREMGEEIGTSAAEILAETPDWISYDLPPEIAAVLWGGRYRGQRQKWFLLRFLGRDADIEISTRHPEFSAWRWTDFETLPEMIVPFKRDLYRRVVTAFAPAVADFRRR